MNGRRGRQSAFDEPIEAFSAESLRGQEEFIDAEFDCVQHSGAPSVCDAGERPQYETADNHVNGRVTTETGRRREGLQPGHRLNRASPIDGLRPA